jgi:hypothetical protein
LDYTEQEKENLPRISKEATTAEEANVTGSDGKQRKK